MQRVAFNITGATPLMVTAPNNVPTDAPDFERYKACFYVDEQGFYIPGESFYQAAKAAAEVDGSLEEYKKAVRLTTDRAEILYQGPETIQGMFNDYKFVDRRFGKLKGQPVEIVRPIFPNWGTRVEFIIKEDIMPPEKLLQLINDAGFDIGVGAYRQRFGRFEAAIAKE